MRPELMWGQTAMRAEIVSIGTELLLGAITDTNATYLAQRLATLGIDCFYVSQVGDNLGRIVETLKRGWERSDLIITTGGLGPTDDDLTREAIADLLGESMSVEPALEAELRAFFTRRGAPMPETNLKQASLLPSAQPLLNPVGTAPGWWVARENAGGKRIIVSTPGVPYEMKRMWEREVEPRLRPHSATVIVSRTLKTLGMGESLVADKVKDLLEGSNPTLAPYAKQDGVHLRITAKAHDAASAAPLIAGLEGAVRVRLGDTIYGADDDTPQGAVNALLEELGYSCLLLEVGRGAAGALSPLLGVHEAAQPYIVRAISVSDLTHLDALIGGLPHGMGQSGDLQAAAKTLQLAVGADVVLAVAAQLTRESPQDRTVTVEAEIVLLTPSENSEAMNENNTHPTRLRQSWKTDIDEVKRLIGLAAFNMLRLRLLKIINSNNKQIRP